MVIMKCSYFRFYPLKSTIFKNLMGLYLFIGIYFMLAQISQATQVIETCDIQVVKSHLLKAEPHTTVCVDIDYTLISPISKIFYPASPYRQQVLDLFRKTKDYTPNPQIRGVFHLT